MDGSLESPLESLTGILGGVLAALDECYCGDVYGLHDEETLQCLVIGCVCWHFQGIGDGVGEQG